MVEKIFEEIINGENYNGEKLNIEIHFKLKSKNFIWLQFVDLVV